MTKAISASATDSTATATVTATATATATTTATTRRSFFRYPIYGLGGVALAANTLTASALAADPPPSRRFLDAVTAGDLPMVEEWLDRDAGLLFVRNEAGLSAYAVALVAGQTAVAEALRQRGYSPDVHEAALATDWPYFEELAKAAPGALNRFHATGGTAMAAAARGGASGQIWRVYRYGVDPNLRPEGAKSPLRLALDHPQPAAAELTAAGLLGNGAAADTSEPDGTSPLHRAAARGFADIVQMLIRKGADPEARDADGYRALERAIEAGHPETIHWLTEHRSIPRDCSSSRLAYDVDGKPFVAADLSAFDVLQVQGVVGAAHFDIEGTRATIAAFPQLAKAIATTTEGAVEACAHTGRKPIVEDLLAAGAPYSIATATMRGDAKTVKALLAEDPQRVHERAAHDFALLWYPVIGGGLLDLAELLLDSGAQIETQHRLGTTALHWAARSGQLDMVALLVEKGADIQRVGRQFAPTGETPLDIALAKGHDDVVKLLRQRGAKETQAAAREVVG